MSTNQRLRILRTSFLAITLSASIGAFAQTTTPQPGSTLTGAETGGGPRFEAVKQKHLERLQLWMTCVRQSTTFETMKACRPHKER